MYICMYMVPCLVLFTAPPNMVGGVTPPPPCKSLLGTCLHNAYITVCMLYMTCSHNSLFPLRHFAGSRLLHFRVEKSAACAGRLQGFRRFQGSLKTGIATSPPTPHHIHKAGRDTQTYAYTHTFTYCLHLHIHILHTYTHNYTHRQREIYIYLYTHTISMYI